MRGAVDRLVFEAFVERVLVPDPAPGQIVVLDNLSVHKSATARARIEAAGCQLVFLPTYSPDFNPIEHAFAKTKQALRRAGARSFETIVAAVGGGAHDHHPGRCPRLLRPCRLPRPVTQFMHVRSRATCVTSAHGTESQQRRRRPAHRRR